MATRALKPANTETESCSNACAAIMLKVAAYDEGISRLGKQEVHARGILNFARAEMLDVLKKITGGISK